MKETEATSLNLEVEEVETRERLGGSCTSSTTRSFCTCACFYTTTLQAEV